MFPFPLLHSTKKTLCRCQCSQQGQTGLHIDEELKGTNWTNKKQCLFTVLS